MTKILIADPMHAKAIQQLKDAGFEVVEKTEMSPLILKTEIVDTHVLLVRSETKVTKEIITAGKMLRVIGRVGVALDNIDLETAKSRKIQVINSPEAPTISVAELAMCGILSCARNLTRASESMKAGKWIKKELKGYEIKGKTLGIIGLGRIGLALARIALGFGMNVVGFDVYPECLRNAKDCGVGVQSLDELLQKSDYVSLHIPLLDSTRNLIGEDQLNQMKSTAVLVNTARGGVVDEQALFEALNSGRISMAFLDVFSEEPPETSILRKLISLPNVIATPHIGASTKEALEANSTIIAEKVIKIFKKKPK